MIASTTEPRIKVLGFAGSLRAGSYNRAALRAALELAPPSMQLDTFDLSPIPLFNGDVARKGFPAPVREFREQIAAADALLIVTPEYNFSVPGVLKNAVDWASIPPSPPLEAKPVAMMGASPGMLGTVRAQMHLRQVCLFNNMFPVNRPEVFIMQAAKKFDAAGNLVDEPTRGFIRALLEALVEWTHRLQAQSSVGASPVEA